MNSNIFKTNTANFTSGSKFWRITLHVEKEKQYSHSFYF